MTIKHPEHPPRASGDRDLTSHRGSINETGRPSGVTEFRENGCQSLENAHDERAPRVVIVNETAARLLFRNQAALGSRLISPELGEPVEVVGICGDVKQVDLAAPAPPEVYFPFAQWPSASMTLYIRSTAVPKSIAMLIRGVVRQVDRGQPIVDVATMREVLSRTTARMRFILSLLGIFAGIATALAAIGLYGVITYWVRDRQTELGIRIALGASRGDIVRLVTSEVAILMGCGLALGLLGAVSSARRFVGLLFEVTSSDPLALGGAVLLIVVAALLALYVPIRTAMQTDPVVALKAQ